MARDHRYFVYIMTSGRNGTLYVGVTNDLIRRSYEHREGLAEGFTKKYGAKTLVWFEEFNDVRDAIDFEKRLKKWERKWKLRLIEEKNPDWEDVARNL